MTLTKRKLIACLKDGLESQGYTEMKESQLGTSGFFCKYLGDDMFLSLGLEISGLYDFRYTASYYWSMTTQWSAIGGDIPKDSYCRINRLMSREEKEAAFGHDPLCWWNQLDKTDIGNFLNSVKMTELRLLSQKEMKEKIINSKDVQRLCVLAKTIQSLYKDHFSLPPEIDLKFTPSREIDGVPIKWFEIAEYVLRFVINEKRVNRHMVIIKASDAFRQFVLRNR